MIIKFLKLSMLLSAAILFVACKFLPVSSFTVVRWEPGNQELPAEIDTPISVTFNREAEQIRTEEAFSLTSDGTVPIGRFSWDGNSLVFSPYDLLSPVTEYQLKVTKQAEDLHGISLDDEFIVKFRTGEKGERPTVVSCSPENGDCIDERFTPLKIKFSIPVNFDTLLNAFKISPNVKGIYELDSKGKTLVFTPAEPFKWREKYEIRISTDLISELGYSLSEEFVSEFTVGSDCNPPLVTSAGSEDGTIVLSGSPSDNPSIIVNNGWEKDSSVLISFSEKVEKNSAESSVIIEPAVPFDTVVKEKTSSSEMIINFTENLVWHKLYKLSLSANIRDMQNNYIDDEHIYYLYVDGPASKPPLIQRVDFIPDEVSSIILYDAENPSSGTSSHQILDTSVGDAVQNPFFIDYYITLAEGAMLPFFEFTENFIISPQKSCLTISYLNFELYNPGEPLETASDPKPEPTDQQAVLRLILEVTDSKTDSGSVLFQVFGDLADSLENIMKTDWTMDLFDEDN